VVTTISQMSSSTSAVIKQRERIGKSHDKQTMTCLCLCGDFANNCNICEKCKKKALCFKCQPTHILSASFCHKKKKHLICTVCMNMSGFAMCGDCAQHICSICDEDFTRRSDSKCSRCNKFLCDKCYNTTYGSILCNDCVKERHLSKCSQKNCQNVLKSSMCFGQKSFSFLAQVTNHCLICKKIYCDYCFQNKCGKRGNICASCILFCSSCQRTLSEAGWLAACEGIVEDHDGKGCAKQLCDQCCVFMHYKGRVIFSCPECAPKLLSQKLLSKPK